MGNFNPKLPTKHVGTNKYITFFVSRNRSPTGADYRQPETGTLYSVGTVWQVSKNPTTGTEGDLWMLSKIVANVAYWIQIANGAIVGETITGQSGGPLSPVGGNWNIFGLGEMTTSGSGNTLSIFQPKAAKIIVDPTLNFGNYQTLTAAVAAATSGTTILVRPGTYSEAPITLKSGINIVGLNSYNQSGQVLINTKFIDNGSAISCTFSGLTFSTPTDYSFVLTGNSVVVFVNCYLRGSNHTILSLTTSSTMRLYNCLTDIQTTGIAVFDMTGGSIFFKYCTLSNSGLSTTAGTFSSGGAVFDHCISECSFASSGTAQWNWYNCRIDTSPSNSLALTSGGNQTHELINTSISSGSSACVSVGAGTTVIACNISVKSSTTNVLTGAGILQYGNIVFYGSSNGHNVVTETALTVF